MIRVSGCVGAGTCDTVINVTGTGNLTQAFSYAFGAPQPNVIWNFEEATGVTINNEWWAAILAPDAVVKNTAPINGNLIAMSFGGTAPIGSGELHLPTFDCSDNLCGMAEPPISTPEPGSLSMLGLALATLAIFGVSHRRRRPT